MSLKFDKNRSVHPLYLSVPLTYTRIKHPQNLAKELVLVDWVGRNYVAAWRNEDRCNIGLTFLVKAESRNGKPGFIFKDKWHSIGFRVMSSRR